MQVVGYYQANEMCDDMELGPFGKTIAEKIRAQCKHAAVLLVRADDRVRVSLISLLGIGCVSRSTVHRCIPQRTTCGSCPLSAARRHQRYLSPLQRWRRWSSL